MTTDRDSFELLNLANPIDEATLTATAEYLPAQRTLATIRAQPSKGGHRRLIWVIAAILIALLVTAAAIVVTRRGSDTVGVACFAQPSRAGALAAMAPSAPTAIETCAQAWRDGRLGPPQAPPPLVGCVLETGAVGVFPSDDSGLCDRLGLARHDPTQRFDIDPAVILAKRITDYYRATGCPDAAAIDVFTRQQFTELGLTNWKIRPVPGPSRPGICATGSVDAKRHTVFLSPAPPIPSTTTI